MIDKALMAICLGLACAGLMCSTPPRDHARVPADVETECESERAKLQFDLDQALSENRQLKGRLRMTETRSQVQAESIGSLPHLN